MNCKFCNAEMEDGVTVCPSCGKDNAPEKKRKERKPLTAGKLAVIYIVVLAVLALGVAAAFTLINRGDGLPAEEGSATIAENGSKDDVTCKGTYTVSDSKAASKANKVVATIGDTKLTNADLQVYYYMMIYNYMDTYGTSGVDFSAGLDTQMMDEEWTWQQYFLDSALNNWHMYYALSQEAAANGHVMEADLQAYLDGLEDSINAMAEEYALESADALIQHDMGPGSSMEAYQNYMNTYYGSYSYYNTIFEGIELTEDEVSAYYDENADTYAESGIEKDDSVYVNVRHILVKFADDAVEEDYPTYEAEAQAILDEWLAGEATEESFGELANQRSADSDGTDGGLYEYVYEGQMVKEFNDWCFDDSRQAGDYAIVQTTYGYHVMYFCDSIPVWYAHAESDAETEWLSEKVDEIMEKYPMDVKYNKIALGYVPLG